MSIFMKHTVRGLAVLTLLAICVIGANALAATPAPGVIAPGEIPPGSPLTVGKVEGFIRTIVGFLIGISGVILAGSMVVAGIVYTTAGQNPAQVKQAQAMFWSGVIGAFILFGVGVLIRTIQYIVTAVSTGFF